MTDIVRELCDFISKTSIPTEFLPFFEHPTTLIGRKIKHKFQEDILSCTWYIGTVIDYRVSDKTHCIIYDGEEEVCYFDLLIVTGPRKRDLMAAVINFQYRPATHT